MCPPPLAAHQSLSPWRWLKYIVTCYITGVSAVWLYKHCTTGSTSSEEHSAVLLARNVQQGEFYFVCYMTKAMYLVIEHDVQHRKLHVYIKG